MKPSATSSALRPSPTSPASASKAVANARRIERLILPGAENLGKIVGDQLARHDVGVGDRERAAAAIAFGSGIGARRIRTDAKARAVEMQDRSAARRDGVDHHHRRAHAHARDLGLEGAFVGSVEMRDVGRGSPHVEADDFAKSGAPSGLRHRHDAARRPRQNRVLAGEQFGGGQAARRHHEHHARAGPLGVERLRNARDVARENRREIGVDDGGVAAPDQLDQRRAFVADRNLGEAQRARDPARPRARAGDSDRRA